ncbi:MAG: N-acetylmuramoyl-L-alanine amidase, partial [Lachnospiraceae bacterium]|nr:N-acetylmuramoyl-L-alanine amidase [Lachnospiraceae bacterium]
MVNDMIQKFTISWFQREAGLFFFTMGMIAILVLSGGGFSGKGILTVYAGEQASAITAAENAETEDGDADMSDTAAEEDENIVVVIDPGHGGENLGAEYEEYTEKEMTLIVAKAMKAELEQYEGITVYLTRTGDEDLTLEERCDYAASVNADFLFCLHFNMSEYHTLFGAETWISAFGEQYSKGYAFADIEIGLLQEMGLYSRGIKTRLNDKGEDYYGIIRHSTEQNMPCVLIEHCHLDQKNDQPFYDRQDKLEAFGRLDAEAVAKYYGLRSESLGKDFSDYQNLSVPIPSQTMKPDSTEPDVCMIELVNQNMENGEITISVSAADYDSGMLYYTYSYNGGMTFSELQRWPDKTRDTFEFTLTVP